MYSVQPRRRNLYERHRLQGYLDSKGRSSGRCPRSADRSTKLGLPVLGTVPSVNGPLDQTWSTGAWDGALGQRTNQPNLVYRLLGTVPSVSGPIDRTWSTGAWYGALDVLVPEPGRQLNPLNP